MDHVANSFYTFTVLSTLFLMKGCHFPKMTLIAAENVVDENEIIADENEKSGDSRLQKVVGGLF